MRRLVIPEIIPSEIHENQDERHQTQVDSKTAPIKVLRAFDLV